MIKILITITAITLSIITVLILLKRAFKKEESRTLTDEEIITLYSEKLDDNSDLPWWLNTLQEELNVPGTSYAEPLDLNRIKSYTLFFEHLPYLNKKNRRRYKKMGVSDLYSYDLGEVKNVYILGDSNRLLKLKAGEMKSFLERYEREHSRENFIPSIKFMLFRVGSIDYFRIDINQGPLCGRGKLFIVIEKDDRKKLAFFLPLWVS